MKNEPLLPGAYYYISHRGNNGTTIFFDTENYRYFLRLFTKYIAPVADLYAWVLIPGEVHFLIYTRELKEIQLDSLTYSTVDKARKLSPSLQISHFLNAYTQAVNKRYDRTGCIFEGTFKRARVPSTSYFKEIIRQIHWRPVFTAISTTSENYDWSSYTSISEILKNQKQNHFIKRIFENHTDFENFHGAVRVQKNIAVILNQPHYG